MIPRALIGYLREHFALDWQGIHGAPHWARVRLNGLRLCRLNGADPRVVVLFAFLHDACRFNDGHDPMHGPRAARLARFLAGRCYALDDAPLLALEAACAGHTYGGTGAPLTVQTCWDADRLDLGRVGIRPDPAYLGTRVARHPAIIEEAWLRSRARW